MSEPKQSDRMEKIVALCKRRGFIFQSSEIYGGINGFWDYGPLGAELKRNVKDTWWRTMVHSREDVAGLEATIIMHPQIWRASGHVDTFADPVCGSKLGPARPFNLMFKTYVGPIADEENVAYLRPETAQAIFAQFKNVLETSRQKVPFGIAQVGKAFRNEVTPRNFTFRSREFEQMELEFFIRPDEAVEAIARRLASATELAGENIEHRTPKSDWGWEAWHKYWVEERIRFYESIGLPRTTLEEYWQKPEELAHYARATVDLLFKFPFGTQELEGIAARSDYDLSQHERFSGKGMGVFDEELRTAWAKLDPAKQKDLW